MKERAVVLTVNLDTLEVLTTPFEGQDSIVRANQFMRGEQARGDCETAAQRSRQRVPATSTSTSVDGATRVTGSSCVSQEAASSLSE